MEGGEGLIELEEPALGIRDEDRVGHALQRRVQLGAAGPGAGLGLFPLRDVQDDAQVAGDAAIGRVQGLASGQEPAHLATGVNRPPLELQVGPLRDAFLEIGLHTFAVRGMEELGPGPVAGRHLARLQPVELPERVEPLVLAGLQVPLPGASLGRLMPDLQVLQRALEAPLGLLALSDVHKGGAHLERALLARQEEGGRVDADPGRRRLGLA